MMIYIEAVRDLLRWDILRYWLMAVGITALGFVFLWGSVFGSLFGVGWDASWLVTSGLPLPGWLIDPIWGVLIALLVVASWFATSYFFSVVLLLVLGLFTPQLVRQVQQQHYPGLQLSGDGSLIDDLVGLLIIVGKYLLYLLGLLVLAIPFFPFAPLMFTLWSLLLFRRLLIADVASQVDPSMANKDQRRGMWLASALAYILSLIPVLNLVAPIYGVVLISHIMLQRQAEKQSQGTTRPECVAIEHDITPARSAKSDEASGD